MRRKVLMMFLISALVVAGGTGSTATVFADEIPAAAVVETTESEEPVEADAAAENDAAPEIDEETKTESAADSGAEAETADDAETETDTETEADASADTVGDDFVESDLGLEGYMPTDISKYMLDLQDHQGEYGTVGVNDWGGTSMYFLQYDLGYWVKDYWAPAAEDESSVLLDAWVKGSTIYLWGVTEKNEQDGTEESRQQAFRVYTRSSDQAGVWTDWTELDRDQFSVSYDENCTVTKNIQKDNYSLIERNYDPVYHITVKDAALGQLQMDLHEGTYTETEEETVSVEEEEEVSSKADSSTSARTASAKKTTRKNSSNDTVQADTADAADDAQLTDAAEAAVSQDDASAETVEEQSSTDSEVTSIPDEQVALAESDGTTDETPSTAKRTGTIAVILVIVAVVILRLVTIFLKSRKHD